MRGFPPCYPKVSAVVLFDLLKIAELFSSPANWSMK